MFNWVPLNFGVPYFAVFSWEHALTWLSAYSPNQLLLKASCGKGTLEFLTKGAFDTKNVQKKVLRMGSAYSGKCSHTPGEYF